MTPVHLNWVLPDDSSTIHATRATKADLPPDREVVALCAAMITVPEPDHHGYTARRLCVVNDHYCDVCVATFCALAQLHTVRYRLPRKGFG